MVLAQRITARLEALGMSANAASAAAGLSRDYVRDILRGKVAEPSAARLIRLATVLQCTAAYLTGESDDAGLETAKNSPRSLGLKLMYRLRAGFHEDDDGGIGADISFPMFIAYSSDLSEWVEFVATEQAGGAFNPGMLLHVVSPSVGLADEEYVICLERLQHGGLMRRSVRQLEVSGSMISFTPDGLRNEGESTSPQSFSEDALLSGANAQGVTVVGRVWAAYSELRPAWRGRMRALARKMA